MGEVAGVGVGVNSLDGEARVQSAVGGSYLEAAAGQGGAGQGTENRVTRLA